MMLLLLLRPKKYSKKNAAIALFLRAEHCYLCNGLPILFLGLMGLLLPLFGNVDEVAFLGTLLLIMGAVQVLILAKYGINPGFSWRAIVTLLTFLASILILKDPFNWYLPLKVVIGTYMVWTGIYVVVEGRYSFKRSHIETVVYCGFLAIVMGFSLLKGWPEHDYWNSTTALSVFLLLLGNSARIFIFNRSVTDKRYEGVLGGYTPKDSPESSPKKSNYKF